MIRLRDAARTRLRNWEISDAQLGRTALVLTAPADAVVIEKPVVQGARFEPGETILRLADLSTVWVIAKVPARSEEHTSELQSLMRISYAVFGLKKKKKNKHDM